MYYWSSFINNLVSKLFFRIILEKLYWVFMIFNLEIKVLVIYVEVMKLYERFVIKIFCVCDGM